MADAVEAAIESGLLAHLKDLTFSPSISVAYPNVAFTPPTPSQIAKWLRATFLPADTFTQSLTYGGSNRHAGLLQVDVFIGQGGGEISAQRTAASIIAHFKRGTLIEQDGFRIEIINAPWRMPSSKDDPWLMIPVRIPYLCFASDPA